MVKLSVISQREVGDTLQDFEKRRYLILSALRAQKNLSTAAFFTKRERSSKVSPPSLWRSVHKLFTHAFVLFSSTFVLTLHRNYCTISLSIYFYLSYHLHILSFWICYKKENEGFYESAYIYRDAP